jgi:hypothetical protein
MGLRVAVQANVTNGWMATFPNRCCRHRYRGDAMAQQKGAMWPILDT